MIHLNKCSKSWKIKIFIFKYTLYPSIRLKFELFGFFTSISTARGTNFIAYIHIISMDFQKYYLYIKCILNSKSHFRKGFLFIFLELNKWFPKLLDIFFIMKFSSFLLYFKQVSILNWPLRHPRAFINVYSVFRFKS